MDKKLVQNLVTKTRDDYNKVADHFSSTRYAFNWSRVAKTIEELQIKPGSKVLDLGCGNGRVIDVLKKIDIEYTGLDISENLIKLAQKKYPKEKFVVGDLLKIPFLDNEFDYVLSLATLHHIPSSEQRLNALKEIYRILKPGGTTLVTVWYFWDDPALKKQIDQEALAQEAGKSKLDYGDFLKPWKDSKGNTLIERYFHAWEKSEMKDLLKNVGFTNIWLCDNKEDRNNNLIVTAQK
ncbi:MAG: class I SAM-dependent methyltransferase [Patescibacteria group bacterium]|nr:class I SAM-dependent methyltransferase [Patescibacteria group bacterium]